jgi:hypothetical protein
MQPNARPLDAAPNPEAPGEDTGRGKAVRRIGLGALAVAAAALFASAQVLGWSAPARCVVVAVTGPWVLRLMGVP